MRPIFYMGEIVFVQIFANTLRRYCYHTKFDFLATAHEMLNGMSFISK